MFSRGTFKEALPEVSRARLEQTLYAEYPDLQVYVEKLSEQKTSQSVGSLAEAWEVDAAEAEEIARKLVDVGFFEGRGPDYWVPFLYRDALQMVQGSAD